MKRFEANSISPELIELSDPGKLDDLFETIEEEEDFILICGDRSEVMISNNILGKVMSGDLILRAEKQVK